MEHKCKFVRHRGGRKNRKTVLYKCHGCFRVVVLKKRLLHRALTRQTYRGRFIAQEYYDTRDPGYRKAADDAMRELFSFEFNHPELLEGRYVR